jgi:hypothetical protein
MAIPRLSLDGDRLRQHVPRLKPGKSGVFRELFGETAKAVMSWRCRQSGANPSLPNSLINREKTGKYLYFGADFPNAHAETHGICGSQAKFPKE